MRTPLLRTPVLRTPVLRTPVRAPLRAACALGLAALTTACYTTRPLLGAPPRGVRVVATLNDRGRALMADSIGQAVDRVEGTVVEAADSTFVLAMRRTRTFEGADNPWTGERLTFRLSSLRALVEQRPSRGRTALLTAAGVAAVVALIATVSIVGGQGNTRDEPSGPPQNQFVPRRIVAPGLLAPHPAAPRAVRP